MNVMGNVNVMGPNAMILVVFLCVCACDLIFLMVLFFKKFIYFNWRLITLKYGSVLNVKFFF